MLNRRFLKLTKRISTNSLHRWLRRFRIDQILIGCFLAVDFFTRKDTEFAMCPWKTPCDLTYPPQNVTRTETWTNLQRASNWQWKIWSIFWQNNWSINNIYENTKTFTAQTNRNKPSFTKTWYTKFSYFFL